MTVFALEDSAGVSALRDVCSPLRWSIVVGMGY